MELLQDAISQDLCRFACGAEHFTPPPSFSYYEQVIESWSLSATQLNHVIAWLSQSGPNGVPHGYVAYISLFLRKHEASKRLDEYRARNLCVVCYCDIGEHNPRQLCRKTSCPFQRPRKTIT
jgi:hypothetical protein